MTRFAMLLRTVELCDRFMQRQLIDAEILLVDLGATEEELEHALGPNGFARRMLREDRDRQVRAAVQFVTYGATVH
jgi:hypothetical protein